MLWPKRADKRRISLIAGLVVALALAHGLLYTWLIPPWQAPDEPAQFEYAALMAALGRTPAIADTNPALEHQIIDSLLRNRFFEYLTGVAPQPPPRTLEDARALFFMPRQVGSDPPLYFALAALPLRFLSHHPIEFQLWVLRLLGVLFVAGSALCAYGAGREMLSDQRLAMAVGTFVALHPMFVFIGVGAGNDGLANMLGAALCWALLRIVRRGMSLRRAALVGALLALGVLTKRTFLPLAALTVAVGAAWAVFRLARMPWSVAWRISIGASVLLLLSLGAGLTLIEGRAATSAAYWSGQATAPAPRVTAPGTGKPALLVAPGQIALQSLPDVTAEWAQNQDLTFSARVWSAGEPARGRMVIDFGWAATEQPFEANADVQTVQVRTFVPLYCPYVHVVLHADEGTIYTDQLVALSDRQPNLNLLVNGDATNAALHPDSVASRLDRYLRVRELHWAWRSGQLPGPPPLGWDLARIFFVSFWGQFGWMSLPLVGGTPWEGALAVICLGGLAGVVVLIVGTKDDRFWILDFRFWNDEGRRTKDEGRRTKDEGRSIILLLLLVASGLLFPLLNAYTQPRGQVIQQGRYLFPALVPVALLLALGWRTLLPPRWYKRALGVWAAFWFAFAAAAISMLVRFY
jgi:hypothetical protein